MTSLAILLLALPLAKSDNTLRTTVKCPRVQVKVVSEDETWTPSLTSIDTEVSSVNNEQTLICNANFEKEVTLRNRAGHSLCPKKATIELSVAETEDPRWSIAPTHGEVDSFELVSEPKNRYTDSKCRKTIRQPIVAKRKVKKFKKCLIDHYAAYRMRKKPKLERKGFLNEPKLAPQEPSVVAPQFVCHNYKPAVEEDIVRSCRIGERDACANIGMEPNEGTPSR